MPWRPSTSTRRVRRPPAARARASAAATVVFPVPPLPVTTCSRAGQRSRADTCRAYPLIYVGGSAACPWSPGAAKRTPLPTTTVSRRSAEAEPLHLLDVADEPSGALDHREVQLLARLLHVGCGQREGRGQHRAVLARGLGVQRAPRVLRVVVQLVLLSDFVDLVLQLPAVPGGGAHQRSGLLRVLRGVDRFEERLRGGGRRGLAGAVVVARHDVRHGEATGTEDHDDDQDDHRDEQATPLRRWGVVRRERAGGGAAGGRRGGGGGEARRRRGPRGGRPGGGAPPGAPPGGAPRGAGGARGRPRGGAGG